MAEFTVIQNLNNNRWQVSSKGGVVHAVLGTYATLEEAKANAPAGKPVRVHLNEYGTLVNNVFTLHASVSAEVRALLKARKEAIEQHYKKRQA